MENLPPTKSCRNQLAKIKLYQTWIHLTWGYFWVRPCNLTLNCRSSSLSQATSCRGGMVKKNPINGILKLGQHMSTPWCTEEHPNVPQKNVATHTHHIYIYICIQWYVLYEGCLKGIPPSTYLRIIIILFRHPLSSKKKYSKNSWVHMEKWNNFHQNDTGIVYF